ncbi:hypothetical protein VBG69_00130 [Carnobacterium maltaromaticum]|uniref:HTH cro/C1-type domain-containing protein n=1 Tax=Carnobacterium maltaromaticum TaxID=2751 RepID=A0AAW9JSJ5_CARML|nr:hypothetical protein [Carnobacterium maltaromaticum]MDZ5757534.1 hypothetical protein [Carnobacterium maltaromaticum]
MIVKEFDEIVLVMMKRKEIKLKDIAERIGTSSVYARQVINGFQSGGKATEYRNQIAEYLEINPKYENEVKTSKGG